MSEFRLILASQSPRRKDLLTAAGVEFEIYLPQIEEKAESHWAPDYCVQELARRKAEDVVLNLRKKYQSYDDSILILAADTIVSLGQEIFGKPRSPEEAYTMLKKLSHNCHHVLTGVCVWPLSWPYGLLGYASTSVIMRPMSDNEIQEYIDSGEPMGKAGAYAIQETADRFVEKLEGPWDNVVGLPMELVWQLIAEWRRIRQKPEENNTW